MNEKANNNGTNQPIPAEEEPNNEPAEEETKTWSIGGSIGGLNGSVVIQNNNDDDLTISSNGTFRFNTPLENGQTYSLTVKSQPLGQTCTISDASGTASSDVSEIQIACSTFSYTVRGTVNAFGSGSSLKLKLNGSEELTLQASDNFSFEGKFAYGASYEVTVSANPTGKTCTVNGGIGTMSDDVDVSVTCSTTTFTISGAVNGLIGSVVIRNSSGSNLTLSSNGSFTLSEPVNYNSPYLVSVLTHPTNLYCVVINREGTATANVADIEVRCLTPKIMTVTTSGTMSSGFANATLATAAADGLCTSAFGSGYKALFASSVRNLNLDWPLEAYMGYVRADGTIIGETDGEKKMRVPFEHGISTLGNITWIGLNDDYTIGNNCSDWTSSSGSDGLCLHDKQIMA